MHGARQASAGTYSSNGFDSVSLGEASVGLDHVEKSKGVCRYLCSPHVQCCVGGISVFHSYIEILLHFALCQNTPYINQSQTPPRYDSVEIRSLFRLSLGVDFFLTTMTYHTFPVWWKARPCASIRVVGSYWHEKLTRILNSQFKNTGKKRSRKPPFSIFFNFFNIFRFSILVNSPINCQENNLEASRSFFLSPDVKNYKNLERFVSV